MIAAKPCELYFVHYIPNVVMGASVTIGIILVEVSDKSGSFADVRFLKKWGRVKAMFPTTDVMLLQEFEADFRQLLIAEEPRTFNYWGAMLPRRWLLRTALDSFSNAIVFSDPLGVMAFNPSEELDGMARVYLDAPAAAEREVWDLSTRRGIKRTVENGLRSAGIMELMMKDIPVSRYIGRPSKLRIDFGYQPNGILHLLHAQPLLNAEPEVTQLAHVYPILRDGIEREEHAMTTMTVLTEDILDSQNEEASYARALLEDYEGLEVVPISRLDTVIERAIRELRM
jgi:hypothetical protein